MSVTEKYHQKKLQVKQHYFECNPNIRGLKCVNLEQHTKLLQLQQFTNAAFLWARELVFTGSQLLVFTISQEVSQHQKHGVRW